MHHYATTTKRTILHPTIATLCRLHNITTIINLWMGLLKHITPSITKKILQKNITYLFIIYDLWTYTKFCRPICCYGMHTCFDFFLSLWHIRNHMELYLLLHTPLCISMISGVCVQGMWNAQVKGQVTETHRLKVNNHCDTALFISMYDITMVQP